MRILERAPRKGMEREVTSHLRPTMAVGRKRVPSLGKNRHKGLEEGISLLCSKNSKARVAGPVNKAGMW